MKEYVFILIPLVIGFHLISGYYFSSKFIVTRFKISRSAGYDLYFQAGFWGTVIFLFSLIITIYFSCLDLSFYTGIMKWLNELFEISNSLNKFLMYDIIKFLISIFFISFFFGIFGSFLLNEFIKILDKSINFFYMIKEICIDDLAFQPFDSEYYKSLFYAFPPLQSKIYENAIIDDDFEQLIFSAIKEIKPLSVTMSNGKIYIGWALGLTFIPRVARKDLRMLLIYSGYRMVETKELIITCDYAEIFNEDESHELFENLEVENLEIVLPYSEIQSANVFNDAARKATIGRVNPVVKLLPVLSTPFPNFLSFF